MNPPVPFRLATRQSIHRSRFCALAVLFAIPVLLMLTTAGRRPLGRPFGKPAQEQAAADSSGIRRIFLPFSIGGDSGFLFNREMIPVLAANGLAGLSDSEQRTLVAKNDTAGKYYRYAPGRYCCLLRRTTPDYGLYQFVLLNDAAPATILQVSDSFPAQGEFYERSWDERFFRIGPQLAAVSEANGSGYSARSLLLLEPQNMSAEQPEIPLSVWSSFSPEFQSATCEPQVSAASIYCNCLLEGDSQWLKREDGDWKADRSKAFHLAYSKRDGVWRLTDSSGLKALQDAWLLL